MMTSQNLNILRLELAFRLEKNCQCIPGILLQFVVTRMLRKKRKMWHQTDEPSCVTKRALHLSFLQSTIKSVKKTGVLVKPKPDKILLQYQKQSQFYLYESVAELIPAYLPSLALS